MERKSMVLNTPLIVEKIFIYLPGRDLCRFASVNKLWWELSKAEFNRREKTVHFFQGWDNSQDAGLFEEEIDQQMKELRIKPAYCIAFMTATLYENFEKFFPSHPIYEPKKKKPNQACRGGITRRQEHLGSVINTALKKRLPSKCQVGLYVGSGVVGTETNSKKIVGQFKPALSGVFLSELQQKGLRFYKMRNFDCNVFRTLSNDKDFKSGMILVEYKTIEYYTFKLKEIWNGFSKENILFPVNVGCDDSPLFFGNNIRTACFTTPFGEEEKEVLEDLENRNFLKMGTIAFVFADYRDSFPRFREEFLNKYPFIPIAGFQDKSRYYCDRTDKNSCKCLLVSIDY